MARVVNVTTSLVGFVAGSNVGVEHRRLGGDGPWVFAAAVIEPSPVTPQGFHGTSRTAIHVPPTA